ncbi:hypothetical protein N6C01_003426 [Vibrio metschnikovii]|nr:hypothetical protein [Vibrio metschnikovii]EKO3719271.1 hypothetical protein [Vibrio metschnikovii]EKO3736996.1 hypothetical protein [Vibrio metschnikovii]EKO3747251.1 hypothetical protein [Vibrio metschnikovii]
MDIKIQIIQINQINMYSFSAFPEDRIRILISELNVHYDKINNYLESEVSGEHLNVEVIDSLAKLNEINRLAPFRLNNNPNSGDFRLGIDILESVIALLSTGAGHQSTKNNLIDLGWSLLNKLYSFSFDRLVDSAFLYQWLKSKGLARSHSIYYWNGNYGNIKLTRIKFEPSDDELARFFDKNQQRIFEYMTFEMLPGKEEIDPFSNPQAEDFYHYHQTLMNFKV